MEGIVSVLSSPFNVMLKLLDVIKKYQKKKKTESLFISAFENEIRSYVAIYEKAIKLSEEKIWPIFQSIGNEFTPHDMNELLEAMLPMPLIHAEWLKAFIDFAKACNEVSALKGFMDYLKEANIMLYDFVYTTKNTYIPEEDKVIIDGRYYRFFKTYERDILGEIKGNELVAATRELKPYLEKIFRYVKKIRHYAHKTAFIKRKTLKKYRKNHRVLVKAYARMFIEKTTAKDLRAYVPEKLFPILVFLEEFSL